MTLRPREACDETAQAESFACARCGGKLKQPVELAWVEELAELVGVGSAKENDTDQSASHYTHGLLVNCGFARP